MIVISIVKTYFLYKSEEEDSTPIKTLFFYYSSFIFLDIIFDYFCYEDKRQLEFFQINKFIKKLS